MPDRITLTIRYDFKGESHRPSLTIDLDEFMRESGHLPDFLPLLARANGIDAYGYEYEVLPHGDVSWDGATGLAKACLHEGRFDQEEFERRWHEQERLRVLGEIARQQLGIDDLDADPPLKRALIAAYEAGTKS